MLGLKLNHVSKSGHRWLVEIPAETRYFQVTCYAWAPDTCETQGMALGKYVLAMERPYVVQWPLLLTQYNLNPCMDK